ncbi:hypothetical protein [Catalinimonas niigatensis]|uniref:hypothetical protein n=1 Tax=Catalinimonas niigatensis TaxID=1397264 RepID=UPI0026664AA7|nr:hypothetical protein [Catalinimonas niigatensis]WPP48956.1 hypothetical protein PZB72_20015 [Catalinimonas niigatensis]
MGLLTQVKTSREHFIEQAKASTNPDIRKIAEAVGSGRARLADFAAYSIVDGSGKTMIRFFESQDKEEIGIKNIATARLEKGEVFMASSIAILAKTSVAAEYDELAMTGLKFGMVDDIPGLSNGEWEFEVNNSLIVPKSSMQMFVTTGYNVPVGICPLTNPKILEDNVPLSLVIETKIALPAKTALKAILFGTVAVPA